jgi:predicted MFS family arabinose efflux permease
MAAARRFDLAPASRGGGVWLVPCRLSATHRFPLASLILVGFGVCSATVLSSASAAVQRFVPDHLRNAATALQVTIVLGINPLGSALTGWMIELFGPHGGSAVLGAATLAAVVTLTFTRRLLAVGAPNSATTFPAN